MALFNHEQLNAALAPKRETSTLGTVLRVAAPLLALATSRAAPFVSAFSSGVAQGFSSSDLREQEQEAVRQRDIQRALLSLGETEFEQDLIAKRQEAGDIRDAIRQETIEKVKQQHRKELEEFKQNLLAPEREIEQAITERETAVKERQASTGERQAATAEHRESRLAREAEEEEQKFKLPPAAQQAVSSAGKIIGLRDQRRAADDRLRQTHPGMPTAQRNQATEIKELDAKLDEALAPVVAMSRLYGISIEAAHGLVEAAHKGRISSEDMAIVIQDLLSGALTPQEVNSRFIRQQPNQFPFFDPFAR